MTIYKVALFIETENLPGKPAWVNFYPIHNVSLVMHSQTENNVICVFCSKQILSLSIIEIVDVYTDSIWNEQVTFAS